MVKFQWCQNRSFVSASPNLSGERQPTRIVSVPWSYRTYLLFFLIKKVTNLPAGRQENQGKTNCSARFAVAHAQDAELLGTDYLRYW
jgi:hypothetical protein